MKKFALVLTGIGIILLFSTEAVLADDGAIQTMARITMGLNHFPSDDDKAKLQAIIDSDDSSDEEADIAMALANFQHKVQANDKERLEDIISDDDAGEGARNLASILLRTNHAPSDEDETALVVLSEI